jgi:hypothetical protein
MRGLPRVLLTFAALGTLLAGCPSTQVKSTWKDPAAASHSFTKVLVVALVPQEAVRRTFEEQLAARLRTGSVQAAASYQVLGTAAPLSREAVEQAVAREGFDAVLVTQYQGTEYQIEREVPTYGAYVGYMGPVVYHPGRVTEVKDVKLESRFFDAKKDGGKLLWTATTSTVDPSSADKAVPEVVGKIVEQLKKDVRI